MTVTIPLRDDARVHLSPWLERHADGSLDEACAELVDAHLLVCDFCMAAYVALLFAEAAA